MHLFIESMMGNRWKLDGLDVDTPVETLKLLVYRQIGMHPHVQRLFRGAVEITTLADLPDGCTLTLHPRLQTGF
jgi:hypothetical protein